MKCRTPETRVKIVEDYSIKPIGKFKVLGKSVTSCTNDPITDYYYQFQYIHKNNKKHEGIMTCGNHAANHFMELIGIENIPTFDPLINDRATIIEGHEGTTSLSNNVKWDPVAKELYHAINIILLSWKTDSSGAMQEILIKIANDPSKRPLNANVKAVNTVISRDTKKKSLPDMVADLKVRHSSFKSYSFHELHKILTDQYQEVESNYK